MVKPERRSFVLAWILASLPLLGWWTYGLFDLDEGFYAAVVSEMNRRGEWITPFYNGQPWFEKPILLYWASKPFVQLLGPDFGPRFSSVLASVLLIGLVGWFVRKRAGITAAAIAMVVQGTMLLPAILGRMMMTDTLLVACLSAAFLTFYESLVGDRRWRLATAALLGLSVLAKGPVGCAHFAIIAGITYWRVPFLRAAYRGQWLAGTVLLALIVASWYGPAYLVHREVFVQKFLIEQNLNRFTGGDAAHSITSPLGYLLYIPILLVGVIPWGIATFKAVRTRTAGDPLQTYLWIWAVVIFVFFTISKAKLPHYILPCFTPLAVLTGCSLAERWGEIRWSNMAVASVGVFLFVQGGFTAYYNGTTIGSTRIEGPQAEVHMIARSLRPEAVGGLPVVVYQMPRRQKALGTGGVKVQETSYPSFLLYLNATVIDAETLDEIPDHCVIVTRLDREIPERTSRWQRSTRFAGRYFIVYDIHPAANRG